MKRYELLYIVNVDWFFLSHWVGSATYAKNRGINITVACEDTGKVADIEQLGFHSIRIPKIRAGGVFNSLRLFFLLWQAILSSKPDIVHLVTIKPMLLGGVILRFFPKIAVVSYVSGLGYVFTGNRLPQKLLRLFLSPIYKIALGKPNQVIVFENQSDRLKICNLASLDLRRTLLVKGSGIDTVVFHPPKSENPQLTVMMASRLLKDKGILEFLQAAQVLQHRYQVQGKTVRFVVVGDLDLENPASLSIAEFQLWKSKNILEFWGFRSDMNLVLQEASVVVLPSYREGFPRVLMEAASCGRAVITTDVPGCRDAVLNKCTAILVPAMDIKALVDAIDLLISDSDLRNRLGRNGRKLALESYDIKYTSIEIFDAYKTLLNLEC